MQNTATDFVTIQNTPDFAPNATARSGVYGLLARIFQREPDSALVQQLQQPQFTNALECAGISSQAMLLYTPMEKLIEALTLEYTRLFIGPGPHLSPHESVYRQDGNGRLWGESTVKVKAFIEYCGFGYITDHKIIPDHISIEMEFMQAITAIEAQARQNDDEETILRCLQIEFLFIREHLGRWVTHFCNKIMNEARHPFYSEMASLTLDFIEKEKHEQKNKSLTKRVEVSFPILFLK